MYKKTTIIILIIFSIVSCDKIHVLNTLIIYEDSIIAQNDSIPISINNALSGYYIYRVNGKNSKRRKI